MPHTHRVNAWLGLEAGLWLGIFALPLLFGRPVTDHDLRWIYLPALVFSWISMHATAWPWRGPADLITALRGLGWLIFIVTFRASTTWEWTSPTLLLALLLLDLVDGWVARRTRVTESGAWLDMESDQLAVVTMSLLAAPLPGVGRAILLLPVLRYLFIVGMFATDRPAHLPRPVKSDNRRGKLICAAVMTSLFLLLSVPMAEGVARTLTILAVLLLGYSFSGDARHLLSQDSAAENPA